VDVSGDFKTLVTTHWKLYSVAGGNRVLQNMAFTHQKFCPEDECSTGNIPDVSAECDIVYFMIFINLGHCLSVIGYCDVFSGHCKTVIQ
jgi:hypothetical protein